MGNHLLVVLGAATAIVLVSGALVDRVVATRRERPAEQHHPCDAHPDPLTCSTNRRAFEAGVRRLKRSARIVGVVVLDLDGLPSINGRFGQDGGDEALARAAAAIHGAIRSKDIIARTSDDRFVVLLPGSTGAQAAQVARRMQAAVVAIPVDRLGPLSVSVGLAHGTGLDLVDMLRTAEQDLHRGRRRRNDRPLPV